MWLLCGIRAKIAGEPRRNDSRPLLSHHLRCHVTDAGFSSVTSTQETLQGAGTRTGLFAASRGGAQRDVCLPYRAVRWNEDGTKSPHRLRFHYL